MTGSLVAILVSSWTAKLQTGESVGNVGKYCVAFSGPRAAFFKVRIYLRFMDNNGTIKKFPLIKL